MRGRERQNNVIEIVDESGGLVDGDEQVQYVGISHNLDETG